MRIDNILNATKKERAKILASKEFKNYFKNISSNLNHELEQFLDKNKDEAVYTDISYNKHKDTLIMEVTSWENFHNDADDEDAPCYQCSNWYTKYNEWGFNTILNTQQRNVIEKYIKKYLVI